MRLIYSHIAYILKGYTRLSHEAVLFDAEAVREVPDAVAEWLLGAHPLEFCPVDAKGRHQCQQVPVGVGASYSHEEIESPPADTQMVTQHGKRPGRPGKR